MTAKKTSGWRSLAKYLATVCVTAVGFVMGAAIGMGVGILAGAWTGPGAFVTAALGLTCGAAKGAVAAAAVSGFAGLVYSDSLFFKESKLDKSLDEVVSRAKNLAAPSA